MATHVELLCRCASAARADEAMTTAEREVRRFERIFSRFIKSSDIQRLNNERAGEVCAELLDVVAFAMAAREATGGRFDPTVYDALTRSGAATGKAAHWVPGNVRIDRARRRIELAPGTRLDLGAIVKGWCADRACARLATVGSCLVNAGGDIALRTVEGDTAWPVGVGSRNRVLDLKVGGVATSSQSSRKWVRSGPGGSDTRHIIDPATGEPSASDASSVTVIARNATVADVWATALVTVRAEEAIQIADAQRLACLIERRDGSSLTSAAFTR